MAMAVVYDTLDGVLLSESRSGTVTEYVSDPLGSLKTCNDPSGSITYTAAYWPYGELRSSTGSNPSPWGFVGLLGYLTDTATRLYVRMRHYLPNLTIWLTVDPLWPSTHRYGYADSAPATRRDRWGLRTAIVEKDDCAKNPKTCIDLLTEGSATDPLKSLLEDCVKEGHGDPDDIVKCLEELVKSPIKIGKELLLDKLFEYLACIYGSQLPGGTFNIDPCKAGQPLLCCAGKDLACQVRCIFDAKDDPFGFKHTLCKWKCYAESVKCLASGDSYGL